MTVKTATEAMRRKAGAGRAAPEIGRMTAPRAWKLAMPHAAQGTLGVQAGILRAEESRVVADEIPTLVPERALIALLEGPDERFGLAILDAPVLSGLIEAATTGRIAARQAAPREPTRTDAVIAADLLDALLEGFETNLVGMDEPPNLGGYRYAAPLADARAIALALAEGPYTVFRLSIDLGGGARQGDIVVAFPVAARGVSRGADAAAFQQALTDNVMGAEAQLDAVLFRVAMPLGATAGLAPGDIIRVPLAALAAIGIEAGRGKPVARARLGQQGGFRAVRISHLADVAEAVEDADFQEAAPAALLSADLPLAL